PEPAFLPGESALDVPPLGPNTVLASAHPYLFAAAAYAQRERGCPLHKSIFPYGPDGTRAFYETLAAAFGKTVSYAEREREAWAALASQTAPLRDKTIVFCSDAMLELPLARTLRAAGARVPVVGTPNIYKKFHAAEIATLGDVEILERPDRFVLFDRLAALAPDLVVANLNIANPLEGMGFAVKWSTELTFQPIHGFSGASTLFGMFAATLRRHEALAARRARDGAPGAPIDLGFFHLAGSSR
ncbi:MAG: ferredoxin:protochlorophyllide reductase (ATP-dependent) subunit N, partial [Candidatus Eremiobacteraeota bacterium]|nr:ferredoxin:protochlorophyllide reductase (ATP-dependent) subunit N [Candidatus Eremiobacteraeota bacterium]